MQPRRRLVQEQDLGAAGQGAGEGHSALLSAGQGGGATGGEGAVVREPYLGEERPYRLRGPVVGEFAEQGADAHPGVQSRAGVLADVGEPFAAQGAQLPFGQGEHVVAEDFDPAGGAPGAGWQQSGEGP